VIKNLGNTGGGGGGGGGVAISAAATSFSTGTVVFSNSNGVSFGLSNNNVLTASVAAGAANINFSAGTTSSGLGSVVFSNSNGLSFGLNGSTITGSASQSNQAFSAQGGSSAFQTLVFTNSNGVSFSNTAGSIWGSVAAQSAQTQSNIAGIYDGANSISTGTVQFSNANGVSFGINGQTITASVVGGGGANVTNPFFEPPIIGVSISPVFQYNNMVFQPFVLEQNLSMVRLQLAQIVTSQSTTTMNISASISGGTGSSASGSFLHQGTMGLFSRVSTGTNVNSSNIVSFFTNTYSYGLGLSDSVSWSTNAGSATASWTTSGAISYIGSVNSAGVGSTASFGTSGSGTFSSLSAGANTFQTTIAASFASLVLSNTRPVIIPFGTSLSPGEYWLGLAVQSSTGSTNDTLQNMNIVNARMLMYTPYAGGNYAEMGGTVSVTSSGWRQGQGSYSLSANITTTIALPTIQWWSAQNLWFNMQLGTK